MNKWDALTAMALFALIAFGIHSCNQRLEGERAGRAALENADG